MSGVVDSSDVHTDAVHPIHVLQGLNLVNIQAKLVYGHFGTAETPD